MSKHNHYFKDVSSLQQIDVYRVIELFEVPAGPVDHAVKKLLCAGNRGHKDLERDIQDAIDSLVRWQQMRQEDARREIHPQPAAPDPLRSAKPVNPVMFKPVGRPCSVCGWRHAPGMLCPSISPLWTEADERHIDLIAQNGPTGCHYPAESADGA